MNQSPFLTQTQFDNGLNIYAQKRRPGELDLVAESRACMVAAGLGQAVVEHFDTDPLVVSALEKTPVVQRHLLNRYWFQQMAALGAQTLEARSFLIHEVEPADWLSIFQNSLLPRIIGFDLPKALPAGV